VQRIIPATQTVVTVRTSEGSKLNSLSPNFPVGEAFVSKNDLGGDGLNDSACTFGVDKPCAAVLKRRADGAPLRNPIAEFSALVGEETAEHCGSGGKLEHVGSTMAS
jgi:hypothetical protein